MDTPKTENVNMEEFAADEMQHFTNRKDLALAVTADKMAAFNYALYQNKVSPIQGIRIINQTGDPISGLRLRITSEFEFFKPYEMALPELVAEKPYAVPDPRLKVNGQELATMTDAVNTMISIELVQEGETLCGVRDHMMVLAYDQWMGGYGYRDLLPAFVISNHPVIPALMHDASDILTKWGKLSALNGYQSHDPNRVRELAAAAYTAIQKKNIVYAEPPVSFFTAAGQQIRTPETIMEQRLGTCMDMTLLYAALLEGMGLQPLLVLLKGHIFAGVWLKQRSSEEMKSANMVIDDVEQLTMRINTGSDELTFVECTSMCAGESVNFEEAEAEAKDQQDHLSPVMFEMAIDVAVARLHGIKPMPPRLKEGNSYQIQVSDKDDKDLSEAPESLDLTSVEFQETKPNKITNKRDLWESKLLDLTTRNMLLNLPNNSSIQPIMSSHIDELEDALADGHEFQLQPLPDWIMAVAQVEKDEEGKEHTTHWLTHKAKEVGVFEITDWPVGEDFNFNEKLRQEYRNHRLYTYCTEKQLDKDLTTIYRAARASQQENGVSSMYLAVGLLRWFDVKEPAKPCYAPLILLPIEIVRKSANQGYALHAREDDPHFNTTLLEMLKQNYNLSIGGLDPLPTDDHGIDIKKVFAIVRNSLYTVKNWDVVETCVIGNFKFAQFAMWNDIHTAGDMLENSAMVRSLMRGHIDWDVTADDGAEQEKTYLPITVDATQLDAIEMAGHGRTFVLHGPPGTGKSQTITGMIANLMVQGKKVLFVAEKMAALSVVQRRLTGLGIDDFCLELHSDKANKKQVLTQLDKALAIKHPDKQTEYKALLQKTAASRAKLDGYAEHLHAVRDCGYSLRDLIARYELVRDAEHFIRFDAAEAGILTKLQLDGHADLIGRLTAAGAVVGNVAGHPLKGVGLLSYSAEVRGSLPDCAADYRESLEQAFSAGIDLAKRLGLNAPKNQADFAALERLSAVYEEKKATDPLILKLLQTDEAPVYEYYVKKAGVDAEGEDLLKTWKPEFLTMDMPSIMVRYEAANKKFFGKSAAINAVMKDVQVYALTQLNSVQLPVLTKKVEAYQADVAHLKRDHDVLSETVLMIVDRLGDRASYDAARASAVAYQKQAAETFPGGLKAILEMAERPEDDQIFTNFRDADRKMRELENRFNGLLIRQNQAGENWPVAEIAFCNYIKANGAVLKDWALYNQVRQECVEAGIEPVAEAYEGGMAPAELEISYRKGFYYALINHIISQDDVLSSFSGATFNEAVQQFKNLDEQMLQLTKEEIYYQLASHVPTSWDTAEIGKEMNLLRKAIGSNARGMSIRELFERIPHVLQALCPCMLMSPNSVAQYLAQKNDLFDVVIFDEASQLPTCKAVGALCRAKNAVIVGDPKQMPPTTFFAGSGPEVDDLELDDLDSILDDALALGIPSQYLQWHYRSTHESLIAFSNNEFYDNKMYTFPSANDRERHVSAVRVPGVYSKGINVKEAEAVVEEILRRYLDPELKKQSIGVVTFNIKQQALIENLLAKQYQANQDLDLWANNCEDPLFVKNLENVQGDERDVILFSIGYGPDEKGNISMNFGPINQTGGNKRLNVAFSRSRVTMMIFESMQSTDIRLTPNSPEGLVAFHDFLKFAEGHDIVTESVTAANEKLSRAGILQSICKLITDHGYQCATMIGHSDFHVDIGVVDPLNPDRYMLGILLDGDGYRQTKNTRDREVAQISVLQNLGWTLTRVWTMDWWDNRDKVVQQLLNQLDALKAESERQMEEAKAAEEARQAEEAERQAEAARMKAALSDQAAEVVAESEEEMSAEMVEAEAEPQALAEAQDADEAESPETEVPDADEAESLETEVQETKVEPQVDIVTDQSATTLAGLNTAQPVELVVEEPTAYVDADLPITGMNQSTFIAPENKAEIGNRILAVLAAEAPILKDTLIRRICTSFGVSKTAVVVEATEKAMKAVRVKTTKTKGIICCWSADQDPKTYGGIRISATRSGDEICLQEIRNAAYYVLKSKGELTRDELIKEVSILFGYKRLTKNLEAALDIGIQFAKSSKAIVSVNGGKFGVGGENKNQEK